MIRRTITFAALALLTAATVQAQHTADPDKNVKGGALPAGWSGRADGSAKVTDAKFVTMGSALHVTSGPAAIYWKAKQTVRGPFTTSATFTQEKAPMHPEAYGIVFGGNKLEAPDQTYFYFLVRGDGMIALRHRAGTEVHKVMDWTSSAAVHKQDAAGKATNTLTVDASKSDSVRFFVNGTPVKALSLGNVDGAVGLRVNHNLEVHIADFGVIAKHL